jgi:hypothetical protein
VNSLVAVVFRRRKLLFGLIALALSIIFVCSAVVALSYLTASSSLSASPLPSASSVSSPIPSPTSSPSSYDIVVNQPVTLPNGCISSSQAMQIAKPYIDQYVTENNRTITGIEIRFNEAYKDAFHERTSQPLHDPDSNAPSYPVWFVLISFDSTPEKGSFLSYGYEGIIGYEVGIWADNSQVFCHDELAVC